MIIYNCPYWFDLQRKGEHVSLLTDSGLDILGRLIESNADSPNRYYYKDFIRLWKKILGNSIKSGHQYYNQYVTLLPKWHYIELIYLNLQIQITISYLIKSFSFTPLVVPSALENFQTSLRDPAFYVLWKRILQIFVFYQKQMPLYKPEELTFPNVEIEKIEVDKLVTFFEYSLLNLTSSLYQTEKAGKLKP